MPTVGPMEILVILLVALIVFGPQRLPEMARKVGAGLTELKRLQEELRGELDDMLRMDDSPSRAATENGPSPDRQNSSAIAALTGSPARAELAPPGAAPLGRTRMVSGRGHAVSRFRAPTAAAGRESRSSPETTPQNRAPAPTLPGAPVPGGDLADATRSARGAVRRAPSRLRAPRPQAEPSAAHHPDGSEGPQPA